MANEISTKHEVPSPMGVLGVMYFLLAGIFYKMAYFQFNSPLRYFICGILCFLGATGIVCRVYHERLTPQQNNDAIKCNSKARKLSEIGAEEHSRKKEDIVEKNAEENTPKSSAPTETTKEETEKAEFEVQLQEARDFTKALPQEVKDAIILSLCLYRPKLVPRKEEIILGQWLYRDLIHLLPSNLLFQTGIPVYDKERWMVEKDEKEDRLEKRKVGGGVVQEEEEIVRKGRKDYVMEMVPEEDPEKFTVETESSDDTSDVVQVEIVERVWKDDSYLWNVLSTNDKGESRSQGRSSTGGACSRRDK